MEKPTMTELKFKLGSGGIPELETVRQSLQTSCYKHLIRLLFSAMNDATGNGSTLHQEMMDDDLDVIYLTIDGIVFRVKVDVDVLLYNQLQAGKDLGE